MHFVYFVVVGTVEIMNLKMLVAVGAEQYDVFNSCSKKKKITKLSYQACIVTV